MDMDDYNYRDIIYGVGLSIIGFIILFIIIILKNKSK